MKGRIGIPALFLTFALVGVGMIVGAVVLFHNATTGEASTVKVSECHFTGTGRGQVCTGALVTGGALVGGNGHVVIGTVQGADFDDVGHTLDVRVHGGTAYAHGGSVWTAFILFLFGLFIAGMLGWQAWVQWRDSAPPKAEPAVAGLPTD